MRERSYAVAVLPALSNLDLAVEARMEWREVDGRETASRTELSLGSNVEEIQWRSATGDFVD